MFDLKCSILISHMMFAQYGGPSYFYWQERETVTAAAAVVTTAGGDGGISSQSAVALLKLINRFLGPTIALV